MNNECLFDCMSVNRQLVTYLLDDNFYSLPHEFIPDVITPCTIYCILFYITWIEEYKEINLCNSRIYGGGGNGGTGGEEWGGGDWVRTDQKLFLSGRGRPDSAPPHAPLVPPNTK